MKRTATILTGSAIALISMQAYSAEQASTSRITAVYPFSNGTFGISLAEQPLTCSSTQSPKRFHVKVGESSVTTDGAKQMYAAALLALSTDLRVFLVFDDATSDCFVNRMRIEK